MRGKLLLRCGVLCGARRFGAHRRRRGGAYRGGRPPTAFVTTVFIWELKVIICFIISKWIKRLLVLCLNFTAGLPVCKRCCCMGPIVRALAASQQLLTFNCCHCHGIRDKILQQVHFTMHFDVAIFSYMMIEQYFDAFVT